MRLLSRIRIRLLAFSLCAFSVITILSKVLVSRSNSIDFIESEIITSPIPSWSTQVRSNVVPVVSVPAIEDNLVICLKTTAKYHQTRVNLILQTWFQQATDQTWFFTDAEDSELWNKTGGHLIKTRCSASHNRMDLCCKMSAEFDAFIESGKGWFCHFDDDNYVNIKKLKELLLHYSPYDDWYLGKPSLDHEMMARDFERTGNNYLFWFATGGAGFCLSRSLAIKMAPYVGKGNLQSVCSKTHLPDDCSIGFIVSYYLKKELTVIKSLHSHLEYLEGIPTESLLDQISVSYSTFSNGRINLIKIDGFNITYDPTRFLSLHCHLYPEVDFCGEMVTKDQSLAIT